MKKEIIQYYKSNKVLTFLAVISIFCVIVYELNFDENECQIANLFFQIALALLANFIFSIFQVYIPDHNKKKPIEKLFQQEFKKIKAEIDFMMCQIGKSCGCTKNKFEEYEKSDFELIESKIRMRTETEVQVAFERRNLTVGELLLNTSTCVNQWIDELLSHYLICMDDTTSELLIELKYCYFLNHAFTQKSIALYTLFDTKGMQGNAVLAIFWEFKEKYVALVDYLDKNAG